MAAQNKGTIENRIGLIRKFLPKKTDLNLVSEHRIKKIEKLKSTSPVALKT